MIVRSQINMPLPSKDGRPRQQCPDCSRFILVSQYRSHTQRVHGPKDYACDFQGCGLAFTVPSLLNAHKNNHEQPSFPCEVPQCEYGSSHTFAGLLAHVRRMHEDVFSNYVKGRVIPWSGPEMPQLHAQSAPSPALSLLVRPRLALAPKSAKAHHEVMDSSPVKRQKKISLSEQPDIDADAARNESDSVRKFAVEDLLEAGFTEELRKHILGFNAWIQKENSKLVIHTPEPTQRIADKYVRNGLRHCTSAVKDGICPYNMTISQDTAQLQIKAMSSGKVLKLTSRCFLCIKSANLHDFKLRLAKEKNGILLCSQTARCKNPRLPGRLQCRECADAWTATRVLREMTKRSEEAKPKFGAGSSVKDAAAMADCFRGLWIGPSMGIEWIRFFERVCKDPADVFVVDTETGFNGVVHEVGIMKIDASVIVDDVVNHGCTLSDFYQSAQSGLSEDLQFRAFCAVNKTYGPPKKCSMPGLTPTEVAKLLQAAGMSSASIWVEHSFGKFDYKKLRDMIPAELQYILPRENNIFSTLTLYRQLLPGLFSHKQSHLFTLICPAQAAVSGKRHNALPDAMMCCEILKVAVEKYRSSMSEQSKAVAA